MENKKKHTKVVLEIIEINHSENIYPDAYDKSVHLCQGSVLMHELQRWRT